VALTQAIAHALPAPSAPGLPVFSGQTRLLVVAPHPDDETIATGLLIQQVKAAGGEVRILLLTAGDNNPWPQRWLERRVRIREADRQRWGRRRSAEMLQALQQLGLPASALESMGWPDMGLTACVLQSGDKVVPALAAAIGRFQPSLVVLPSLDDRHPDHGAAHVLVRLALAGQVHPPQLLAYLVHGHAQDVGFIDIGGSLEQTVNKQEALAEHGSQMALSGRRMRALAGRPERYSEVPSTRQASATALPWQPPIWLQPRLRLSVADGSETQVWRWSQAPLQRDSDGTYHLALSAKNHRGPALCQADLRSSVFVDIRSLGLVRALAQVLHRQLALA
jgi:N-acetyl-1-D-myo-inositol-2-amino-2-deoxy-alpha-D-glucopyranoside deacetylase